MIEQLNLAATVARSLHPWIAAGLAASGGQWQCTPEVLSRALDSIYRATVLFQELEDRRQSQLIEQPVVGRPYSATALEQFTSRFVSERVMKHCGRPHDEFVARVVKVALNRRSGVTADLMRDRRRKRPGFRG